MKIKNKNDRRVFDEILNLMGLEIFGGNLEWRLITLIYFDEN